MSNENKVSRSELAKQASLLHATTNFSIPNFEIALMDRLEKSDFFKLEGATDPRTWFATPENAFMLSKGNDNNDVNNLIALSQKRFRVDEGNIMLSSTNNGEVTIQSEFTAQFNGLMKEITPVAGAEYGLLEYFPEQNQEAQKVIWEMMDPITGITNEYVYGMAPETIDLLGYRQIEAEGVPFREQIKFDERELNFWRDLNSGNLAARGAVSRLAANSEKLLVRLMNREYKLIADGLFNGSYSYQGKTILYGIPTGNRLLPLAPWAIRNTPSDPYVPNDSAAPMFDLNNWFNFSPLTVKYRSLIRTMHMNPRTWGAFINNPNVKTFVQYAPANPTLFNGSNLRPADPNWVRNFIPGMENVEIIVEQASYIPDANVTYDSEGFYQNSTANYFLQDGFIFFGIDTVAGGGQGKLGSFQMTPSIAKGGMNAPQAGRWVILDDNTAPGTRGGPAQPFVGVVAGMQGALALPRARDIITAMVFSTTNP